MKRSIIKKTLSMLLVACFLLSLAACTEKAPVTSGSTGTGASAGDTQGTVDPAADPIHIKLPLNVSTNSLNESASGQSLKQFKANVESRTNGKVIIDIYPDSQLASTSEEFIGGLQNGAFEMINLSHASWGVYTDAFASLNTPYLFKTEDVAYGLLNSSALADMIKDEVAADTGAQILSYIPVGFRHITNSKRTIRTPQDMKGLKLRTQEDKLQIAAMSALGCAVTPISFSELFTAMQQKLVDGQENPITNIYFNKFYEVQKYMTLSGHNYAVSVFAIDKDYFGALPEEYRIIIQEEAKNSEEFARKKLNEMESDMLDELANLYAMEITTLTPAEKDAFIEMVKPTWSAVEKTMGAENFALLLSEIDRMETELGLK